MPGRFLAGIDYAKRNRAMAGSIVGPSILNDDPWQRGSAHKNKNWWQTPEGRAAESLVALEELQRSLRRAAGLQIRNLKLCTKVVGYGVYDEMPEAIFAAGRSSKVIVYVEVENFVSRLQDDKQYHTKLQLRLQLFAKGGAAPLWEKAYTNIEDASFNHRRDLYVPVLITLNKQRAGEYVLKVAVDDVHAGKTDERKAPIRFR